MDIRTALEQLRALQQRQYAYYHAMTILELDGATAAPRDTARGRGVAMGILAGEKHKLLSGEEVGKLLSFLKERKEELDFLTRRQVEELDRSYVQLSRIPAEEYMDYSRLLSEASETWRRAKEENDFPAFRPALEQIVAYNRKFARYYDPDKKPYDALLGEYERGMTMDILDGFFATLRAGLVPLLRKVAAAPAPDMGCTAGHFPVEEQRRLSDELMAVLGLDRAHCAIAESEHPFTTNANNRDVRITTHYYEEDFLSSMYSVIHEGGHALYELGVADELQYTCLAGGVSMGIHESQSRFYENIIGRSKPFLTALLPRLQACFPGRLSGLGAEELYRAVNRVEPSLIRTEADELTYSLHVMVRYELEKKLIAGEMEVGDVPEAWNALYREYLGVEVPDDRQGCLQDSHWSGGSFGYFPSYALGSAYGAQMLDAMEKDVDVWGGVGRGDLSQVSAWLREKIHRHGSSLTPAQVLENACGAPFDPKYYLDYLTKKYSDLYRL